MVDLLYEVKVSMLKRYTSNAKESSNGKESPLPRLSGRR